MDVANQRKILKRVAGIAFAGSAAGVLFACGRRNIVERERERLSAILGWREGAVVADVGAGPGALAIAAARKVGNKGHVIATDVDPKNLAKARKKIARLNLRNVTVLEASQSSCGLPAGSCDAILLRGSYHHFADPEAMTADLYRALRPGGVVAVVDFPPRWWLSLMAPVKGVPATRGGHGIRRDLLIYEMVAAGFELKQTIPRWFLDVYCVVFEKPSKKLPTRRGHAMAALHKSQ